MLDAHLFSLLMVLLFPNLQTNLYINAYGFRKCFALLILTK